MNIFFSLLVVVVICLRFWGVWGKLNGRGTSAFDGFACLFMELVFPSFGCRDFFFGFFFNVFFFFFVCAPNY
jgi:hypothetical protein